MFILYFICHIMFYIQIVHLFESGFFCTSSFYLSCVFLVCLQPCFQIFLKRYYFDLMAQFLALSFVFLSCPKSYDFILEAC